MVFYVVCSHRLYPVWIFVINMDFNNMQIHQLQQQTKINMIAENRTNLMKPDGVFLDP